MPGLSKLQKSSLCQLAAKAYSFQDRLGLIDRPAGVSRSAHLAEWRHAEQVSACGVASLSDATNRQYTTLRAHFLLLAGDDAAAFEAHLASGPARGRSQAADTPEARREAIHLIRRELTDHATRSVAATWEPITPAYVETIARAQLKTENLASLTAEQLTKLLYTVKNRISAREGRGNSNTRNKSQRAKQR